MICGLALTLLAVAGPHEPALALALAESLNPHLGQKSLFQIDAVEDIPQLVQVLSVMRQLH